MAGETILIIDDELEISELLELYLKQSGFQTICTDNGQDALKLARSHNPDLIILDVLLPDLDGIEICHELRKFTNIPIIFLSCKSEDMDKILGLTVGGDDYLTKPFSPGELVARVKAHLRRNRLINGPKHQEESQLSFPGLVIDMVSHVVFVNDQPVILSAKEFKLLVLLAQNPNRVFSIEQIFQSVWNSVSFGDNRTVMVHISNLRKKVEPDPSNPQFILTIKGVGYKFNTDQLGKVKHL